MLSASYLSEARFTKVLRRFERVVFEPAFELGQEAREVTVTLAPRDLSIWDVMVSEWKMVPGEYDVHVGSSSKDIRLVASFVVR